MKYQLSKLSGLLALCFALTAPAIHAVPLTTASLSYVGSITPNVPANPASEASYINALIDLAPGASGTFDSQALVRSSNGLGLLPDADAADSWKDETGNTDFTLAGFTGYVLGKYDQDKAGAWVWFLTDFTDDLNLPSTFNGHDLSHASFYATTSTTVPDGGITAILLGLGLVGLSVAARRRILI
jgi:hypothetical protein